MNHKNTTEWDLPAPPARRGRSAEVRPPHAADRRTTGVRQSATAPNATVCLTGGAPLPAPTTPCGRTRSELDALHVKHCGSFLWDMHFFTHDSDIIPGTTTPSGLPRCLACFCTIAQHPSAKRTPEDMLAMVRWLRDGRPLDENLTQRGARFLASNPSFRTVQPSLYFHNVGRDLVAELRDIHACPRDARRPVLMTAGICGIGKTVLLLRALDAIPPAGPTLDVARMYITFDSTTAAWLQPAGRDCFNAALLLRAFHAALTTLGPNLTFMTFLDNADWVKFVDPAKYLPLLADALGVQTLAIAVDKITSGLRDHMPSGTDLEAQTVTQLCDLFRWADIRRAPQADASQGADGEATTAAAVIPILSCMDPRYARAAQRSDDDRTLMWLQTDLAPSLDEVADRVDRSSRLATRLREVFYRQLYAACSGHFRLCASVHSRAGDSKVSRSALRDAFKREVDVLANHLAHEP
jgi:hypothetical protein